MDSPKSKSGDCSKKSRRVGWDLTAVRRIGSSAISSELCRDRLLIRVEADGAPVIHAGLNRGYCNIVMQNKADNPWQSLMDLVQSRTR